MINLNPSEKLQRYIGAMGMSFPLATIIFYLEISFEKATLLVIVFSIMIYIGYQWHKKKAGEYNLQKDTHDSVVSMKKLDPTEKLQRYIGAVGMLDLIGTLVFYTKLDIRLATLLEVILLTCSYVGYRQFKKKAKEYKLQKSQTI